jgi:hypothetical protein
MSKYGKQIDRDGLPGVEPEQGYRNTDYTSDTNTFIDNTSPTAEGIGKAFRANQFAADMWEIFDSAGNLLLKKHEAYGPTNISLAPGGPENGLRVRMHDKMARLNHIIDNPGVDTNDESLEDTLKDLLNYCAIFIMVRKGQWPA